MERTKNEHIYSDTMNGKQQCLTMKRKEAIFTAQNSNITIDIDYRKIG